MSIESDITHNLFAEKRVKVAPSEVATPAVSSPIKRIDNLFFIEEPQNVSVIESKWTRGSWS